MNDFLVHIGWLTLSMSLIILLVLLWSKIFGGRFSAKSRYTVWAVVVLSLCISIGLFKLPELFTFELEIPSFTEEATDLTEKLPTSDEIQEPITNTPSTVIPTNPVESNPNHNTNTNPNPDIVQPNEKQEIVIPTEPVIPEAEPSQIDFTSIIFATWIVGAILYFTVSFTVYIRSTHKYARAKKVCNKDTIALYKTMCRRYKIKRVPSIFVCSEVGSPILYGYTNPTILIPEIDLSDNSLVGVLAHELTHYRRGDIWIKLICLLTESLYWFNPLVHFAAARCNAEMELSCDEEVLAGMDEDIRRSYGNVMLEIVEHCSHRRSLLTTQFNPRKNAVKERIMNILDMTKKKRGRVIITVALILCIVAGTVIGCTVKDNNNKIKESVYTIEAGVTSVDSLAFEKVDTDVITELVIGKDVESIDFAYINTFPALTKVTVEAENEHYRSYKGESDANITMSMQSNEIFYIPASDYNYVDLIYETALTDRFNVNDNIRLYTCGGLLNVYFTREEGNSYWFLKSLEYDGLTKEISYDKQIVGNCSFRAFRIDGGFVATHAYYMWSNAFIFKDGAFIEHNPSSELNRSYGIVGGGDGFYFYPGENGELLYNRITANMVAMQTYDWFLSLSSADRFWKEDGVVTLSGDELVFTPRKTYTVTDYFANRGTTIEDEFERLKNMGVITEYETLEELFAANKGSVQMNSNFPPPQNPSDEFVYEGYTVEYDIQSPYDPSYKFEFHIHLPQINSKATNAVKWNSTILDKFKKAYGEWISKTENNANDTFFLTLSYNTVVTGDVITVYIIDYAGYMGFGGAANKYHIYHYNSKTDKFLTTDEFLEYYAEGQFADYSLSDIVKLMNELDFSVDEVGNPHPLTEENIEGVIPSVFGNGQFDVVFKGYSGGGSFSERVLFSPYPTITSFDRNDNSAVSHTYRLFYPEHTKCREKEMYGQPAGYKLSLIKRSAGKYNEVYYTDCLFLEDIGVPPEGYMGEYYSPVGRHANTDKMYLSVDHKTDMGHLKALIPLDKPDTAGDYCRGVLNKYFSYKTVLNNHKVSLHIAGLVAEVLDAYRNGKNPNELLPASKTEYVPYPLDTVRENPDADEIGKILQNASVSSSGVISFSIDLGNGYKMSLPIGIGSFGESCQAYFTGIYIMHGTPPVGGDRTNGNSTEMSGKDNSDKIGESVSADLTYFLSSTFGEIESSGYSLEYLSGYRGWAGWPNYAVSGLDGVTLTFRVSYGEETREQLKNVIPDGVEITSPDITVSPGLNVSMTGEEAKKAVKSWDGVFFSLENGGESYVTTYVYEGYKITAYWSMPEDMYNNLLASLPEDGGDDAFVAAKKKLIEPFKDNPKGKIVGLRIEIAPTSGTAEQKSDSITYAYFNSESLGELFVPVSYIKNGAELISGDVGIFNDILSDAPKANSLKNTNGILSTGNWEFFPAEVKYRQYSLDNQPDNAKWSDYFRTVLPKDTPTVITDVYSFSQDGTDIEVVTASNIILSGDSSILYEKNGDYPAPNPPESSETALYIISAVFAGDKNPTEIYNSVKIISAQEDESRSISYDPLTISGSFQQTYSSLQYTEDGKLSLCPIYCNMAGDPVLRTLKFKPEFIFADIDGDKKIELIEYINKVSSDMSRCIIYARTDSGYERRASVGFS